MKNSTTLPPQPRPAGQLARLVNWLKMFAILSGMCLLLWGCNVDQESGEITFMHPPTKAPTATLIAPTEIDLNHLLDLQGLALEPIRLEYYNGCMALEIDQGVSILTEVGQPASRLVIQQDYPGKPPMQAYGVSISYAFRFGPEALHFSSPPKIVFSCLKNLKKTLIAEISLGIQADDGNWQQLSVQGDDLIVWTRLENLQPGRRYYLVGPAPMGS